MVQTYEYKTKSTIMMREMGTFSAPFPIIFWVQVRKWMLGLDFKNNLE